MGRIVALCVSARKGEKKSPIAAARFRTDVGIEGDAHAGPGHRQVSLLAEDDIAEVRRGGLPSVQPGDFAENVIVAGLPLSDLGLGSRLRLGADAVVSITQIGKLCHARCSVYAQTGDCLMQRTGLFARVLTGGEARPGDEAAVEARVPRERFQVVIITVSDRGARGETDDTAGPAVAELVLGSLKAHLYRREIVPDERERIAERLRHYCDGHSIDLIITVGGTGFAPRDVTPEAVTDVIHRPVPGLAEVMRAASLQKTPMAMLSRAVCGIRHATLIVSVPGSVRGAAENLSAILPALDHGLAKLRGDPSDCGRTGAEGAA